jgi:hypothetical protein
MLIYRSPLLFRRSDFTALYSREALSLSLEETMPRHFIQLAKSMISKTIHGAELLTLMLPETLLQVVSLTISTFMFSLVEQNSIKRKSRIQ